MQETIYIPDFLTRYYQKGEYPFMSLNDLPYEQANEIKKAYCKKKGIRLFYAEDDYLIHRKEIEKWMYKELIRKGGKPVNEVPVYMCLGESPEGEYDVRADLQKDAETITIPLGELDLAAITFVFPDSMYEPIQDAGGNTLDGRRTNTPSVYLYNELPVLYRKYRINEQNRFCVEAQVWDRQMLDKYWRKMKGES